MTVLALIALLITLLVANDMRQLQRRLRHPLRYRPELAAGRPDGSSQSGPCAAAAKPAAQISVIVPARNEAGTIARCLDGLVCQTLPPHEIIVVDDGSTDGTPDILAGYAARYPGLVRITQARPLPPGWVGKCNACQHGASLASGDWLLFIDADTAAQPSLTQAMAQHAQRRRLDALSVFPFNELGTLAERMILPVFFQFAWTVFPGGWDDDPTPPWQQTIANGQCFMFRADVYRTLGGHACVKDKVLEDVEFAQALRRAGYRLGVTWGGDLVRVRMYHNARQVTQGLAKHAWAGRKAGGWRSYSGIARLLLTTLAPPALTVAAFAQLLSAPAIDPAVSLVAAGLSYGASWLFWRQTLRHLYALPARLAWVIPAGLLAYLLIVVQGTAAIMTRRGVQWKGRSYS